MTSTIELPPLARYQRDAIFCTERNSIIEATTKSGKAQPLDAVVYTTTGPTRMGDLSVGDEVLGVHGKPVKVLEIHPQGERPIYRIEFKDDTVVEADIDHLWEVHNANAKPRILTTRQLMEMTPITLQRCWVPLQGISQFESKGVPVDPYMLGLLIGDGCLRHGIIKFSSIDKELTDAISKALPRGHKLVHLKDADWKVTMGADAPRLREEGRTLVSSVRGLGLMEKYSHEKFIPKVYLYNSVEVRRAILAGILDTDGTVDKHGTPVLEQTSERLAKNVTELVQSLGGSVLTSYKPVSGYRTPEGEFVRCKPVWRQRIRLADASWCFRLKRRVAKVRTKKKSGNRCVRSISFVRNSPAQCIEVDDPRHLYLTNGFIPTHNTAGCIFWLMDGAFGEGAPGREFWWAAPVYPQTEIAYRRTVNMLRDTDPAGKIWKKNDSDLFIEVDTGGTMRFKTAEKPDNLYGEDVHRCVLDEASRMREEAYFAVRSTLTAVKGKLRIIGNVKGKKNWAYHLARRVEAGSLPDWKHARITCHDAVREGIITAEEVEAARRELPDAVFRELYLAEPSEDGSNPFGLSHISACIAPLSTDPPEVFGVDLAKSVDWTVVVGLDKQSRICVYERWQHEPWDRTQARILGIVGDKPTLVDSTGVGDPVVEGMARKAPNIEGFKFTQGSKQQIMEGLAVVIQRHSTTILDGVMRQELESFEYEATRTGVRYAAQEGLHDDTVCALALAHEKARTRDHVSGSVIHHGAKPVKQDPKQVTCVCGNVFNTDDPRRRFCSVRCEMNEKRKDLNWGFGNSR